jgi:hypothetical protein
MISPLGPQPVPARSPILTWKRWNTGASIYAASRYTCETHNAKVRSARYTDKTYRDMLLFERLLVIGVGVAVSPIMTPLLIIHDFSRLECFVRGIDPVDVGFSVDKEREHWLYYV